ncbi:NAD(P)H-hydrate dehydratase [Leucobacter weissii]|uniref:ADP-dependent (S)-NAD(P)H-hydrate dehydratase n=1 Tax=Leucobacter weissii TaxID=1983706 RepID=A0A939S857_9MICO|nr:ADP/ATP-dependent (S)-NAD(P)H-hydrate dehydratase [Leucobacter weissii]MBO1901691.1 NAD(P)H-hydrate dehydratase [Leucobacter weissii]
MIRWTLDRAADRFARPDASSDKYRRGVLGLRTGSAAYPGAAVLTAEAAWRTGIGLVRYAPQLDDDPPALGLPSPAAAVLAARPETVFPPRPAGDGSGDAWSTDAADAWLVGSGTDPARRSFAEREAVLRLLASPAPVVLDAGALGLALDAPASAPSVLTPHRGEFLSLWRASGLGVRPSGWAEDRERLPAETALADAALALAERLGRSVLLKGSLSIAATPGGFCAVSGPATPWLATAGTGDVLAGLLGALVATHAEQVRADPELLGPLAASAAVLHDAAAGRAGAPITALDLARAIPGAVSEMIGTNPGAQPA